MPRALIRKKEKKLRIKKLKYISTNIKYQKAYVSSST
jgi:hypothetical protein